jgi:hypothetical protein
MQHWCVSSCRSSFVGKNVILYVQQPSLLTLIIKGKTIKTTYHSFIEHLQQLLERFHFPNNFITKELNAKAEFQVNKSTDKSMVAHLNHIMYHVNYWCNRFDSYEAIDCAYMENIQMKSLFKEKETKQYTSPIKYWENILEFKVNEALTKF